MKMWLRLKLENLYIYVAYNLPHPVLYYCGVRLFSHALGKTKLSSQEEYAEIARVSGNVLHKWGQK